MRRPFWAMAFFAFPCSVALPIGRGAHDQVAVLGARAGPEPFRSHPDWCSFGHYGGLLADEGIVSGSERWAYRLCVLKAIRALGRKDLRKACFIASWATHYLVERACLAHAEVWGNNFEVISRLPPRYWDVRAPTERRKGSKGLFFFCPPPEFEREAFEKCQGSVRSYFEAAFGRPIEGLGPDSLPPTEGWSLYDAWLTASWAAEILALETLDLESVRGGMPRFKPSEVMGAIAHSERLLQAWLCAVHYGYVAEAVKFEVGDLGPLAEGGGLDKLASMGGTMVVVPEGAPPGVLRAATLVAVELRRALKGAGKKVPPLWRMVRREREFLSLPGPAVVLATPRSRLVKGCGLKLRQGSLGLVAFIERGLPGNLRGALFLLAADEGRLPHLVDFSLDTLVAPLFGRRPGPKLLSALKSHWAGWRLLKALEGRRGEEAVNFALSVPFRNSPEEEARFKAETTKGVEPSGMGDFWDALLHLPTPGGEGSTWGFVKRNFLVALGARGRQGGGPKVTKKLEERGEPR
ncbi:MAG TPA: hypothetical protein EYP65_07615 [Armatimonadetes bacterium]|nr:hypothetical protein [Armatimonadota bacterium]